MKCHSVNLFFAVSVCNSVIYAGLVFVPMLLKLVSPRNSESSDFLTEEFLYKCSRTKLKALIVTFWLVATAFTP